MKSVQWTVRFDETKGESFEKFMHEQMHKVEEDDFGEQIKCEVGEQIMVLYRTPDPGVAGAIYQRVDPKTSFGREWVLTETCLRYSIELAKIN